MKNHFISVLKSCLYVLYGKKVVALLSTYMCTRKTSFGFGSGAEQSITIGTKKWKWLSALLSLCYVVHISSSNSKLVQHLLLANTYSQHENSRTHTNRHLLTISIVVHIEFEHSFFTSLYPVIAKHFSKVLKFSCS